MMFEDLTKNEKNLIFIIREMKAHERLEIMCDQKGREDYYIVTKTLREILD